jgi:hypothetical protein
VGAALGVIPFLVGQAPAGAAVAQDSDQRTAVWTPAGGGDRVPCSINANHEVDTGTGDLDVTLSAGCQGTLDIVVRYPGEQGEELTMSTTTHKSDFQSISLHEFVRTAVTVDYRIVIDGCVSECTHTLQTKTK